MTTKHDDLIQNFKAARRVSTPLVAVTTPDPAATIDSLCDALNGCPKVIWDLVSGTRARGDESKAAASEIRGSDSDDQTKMNPVGLLVQLVDRLPKRGVVFMHMANRFLNEPAVIQGIANLRDRFKGDERMLVMLCPALDLPPELAGDVIVFDEPLPDADAITRIIGEIHESADLHFAPELVTPAVEAVQGLPAFQVEQVVAMSLGAGGLNIPALWERKRRQIELTPGLKVHRDGARFGSIGGVDSIKQFLRGIMCGQSRPHAVVFVDEIEKMMAGSGGGGAGDTSGVSQDQLGSLLTYMQDQQAAGMIFVGPPGSAKSMVAKAAGNEGGIPTIQLDLGGMKGSLVGQSEGLIRQALKVITSVSNGRTLWIATCNSINELPPELRRRFTLGTFFFDLPDASERDVIWSLHTRAFKINDLDRPDDTGWTGAEIRQCCDIAWRLGVSLQEAGRFVVPVSRSASEKINALRAAADGRFLSASAGGVYSREAKSSTTTTKTRCQLRPAETE